MDRPFYSITINGKNTWDEWGLMPVKAGRIEFATPELRYDAVTVAGSDNVLDFTEALTGYPVYNPRKGSIKFRFYDNGTPVRSRFDQLKNSIHGRLVRAVIEDQPEYYYEGRFTVGDVEYHRNTRWAEVELNYILNAYKIEFSSSDEEWLWDPFNFETGVIREYGDITINGETEVTVIGSRKPTVPTFILSSDMTMVFEEKTYELSAGTNIIPTIVLHEGDYVFSFVGNGSVSIKMKAGAL